MEGVTPMSLTKSLFLKAMEAVDLPISTQNRYARELILLCRHHGGRSPVELSPPEIRHYLDQLRLKVPQAVLAVSVHAICFFYTHVVDWVWNPCKMLSLPTRKALTARETPLRRRFLQDMELRNLKPGTRLNYLSQVERFARFFWKSPCQLGQKEIRQYLLYLLEVERKSISAVRTAMTALRFLYRWSLERPQDFQGIPLPKGSDRLPTVLAQEEVVLLLNEVKNLKHLALFSTLYGTGLRVSELTSLKVKDLDFKRKVVFVHQGKGGKDRCVMLSPTLEELLSRYRQAYKPRSILFPGLDPNVPIGDRSVSKASSKYAKKVGLTKQVTAHVFRHSFATHLLESGVDLRTIQLLLGHSSISSTQVYVKLARNKICSTTSPLDLLPKLSSAKE